MIKSKFEMFMKKRKYPLLFIALFALLCVGMTLAHNDEAADAAAKACTNAVFAFDNPNICEG